MLGESGAAGEAIDAARNDPGEAGGSLDEQYAGLTAIETDDEYEIDAVRSSIESAVDHLDTAEEEARLEETEEGFDAMGRCDPEDVSNSKLLVAPSRPTV